MSAFKFKPMGSGKVHKSEADWKRFRERTNNGQNKRPLVCFATAKARRTR